MANITDEIISELKDINVSQYRLKTEDDFQDLVVKKLKIKLKNHRIPIVSKKESEREPRKLIPDITIGNNTILIELKFNLQSNNDIYRLFYQALKYSKLANNLLILFIHDPDIKLTREDIKDLESIEKVKVVRIF